jgi:hypothetical protein
VGEATVIAERRLHVIVRVLAAALIATGSGAASAAEPARAPSSSTAAPAPAVADAPVVALWPAGAPGSEAKKDLPETPVGGNIAGVHNPSLTVFLPDAAHATGAGVVVLPGGGHRFLVVEKEGYTVALARRPRHRRVRAQVSAGARGWLDLSGRR